MARQRELDAANGLVILISFGALSGATRWLAEMDCPFEMLLDSDREIYKAFGLKKSVYKVWSVSCMVYYGEQMAAGRSLPRPYEDLHDDPNQMGGDFILDRNGTVRLMYCSKTAKDRPSTGELVKVLKTIGS